jgi:acyl-CoA synthetase (AMP-forming)/AMP-acid ligase II
MRVEEALFRHAARRPNHTALVCGSQRLTYRELEKAIRTPDGEAVAAFIELSPGARLSADGVGEHCRGLLAGYKKPRKVHFVDSLPRNSLGKVLKGELRKQASKR